MSRDYQVMMYCISGERYIKPGKPKVGAALLHVILWSCHIVSVQLDHRYKKNLGFISLL